MYLSHTAFAPIKWWFRVTCVLLGERLVYWPDVLRHKPITDYFINKMQTKTKECKNNAAIIHFPKKLYINTCRHGYIHAHVHTHKHARMLVHIKTCTHTIGYTHTHTHTQLLYNKPLKMGNVGIYFS